MIVAVGCGGIAPLGTVLAAELTVIIRAGVCSKMELHPHYTLSNSQLAMTAINRNQLFYGPQEFILEDVKAHF